MEKLEKVYRLPILGFKNGKYNHECTALYRASIVKKDGLFVVNSGKTEVKEILTGKKYKVLNFHNLQIYQIKTIKEGVYALKQGIFCVQFNDPIQLKEALEKYIEYRHNVEEWKKELDDFDRVFAEKMNILKSQQLEEQLQQERATKEINSFVRSLRK